MPREYMTEILFPHAINHKSMMVHLAKRLLQVICSWFWIQTSVDAAILLHKFSTVHSSLACDVSSASESNNMPFIRSPYNSSDDGVIVYICLIDFASALIFFSLFYFIIIIWHADVACIHSSSDCCYSSCSWSDVKKK